MVDEGRPASMDPTEAAIRQFIVDELGGGDHGRPIEADASLIRSGVLDSIALLRLIVFIEEQFGVSIGDAEVIPANFETLERIRDFIRAKEGRADEGKRSP